MEENTRKKLVKAIEDLVDKVTGDIRADDALRYTQAAINVAEIFRILDREDKEG